MMVEEAGGAPRRVPPPAGQAPAPVIIRHHGLRYVSEQDVLEAVGGIANLGRVPAVEEVDTSRFSRDVDGGSWDLSHGYVWQRATEIRERLQAGSDVRVIYAGMPEVPHVVALAAYLGDEWPVEAYDFHRDSGTWSWPEGFSALELDIVGLPTDRVPATGPAVLRLELSSTVDDAHIRQFVAEDEEVAHVRIRPRGRTPAIADIVRSPADVVEVRRAVRKAMSALVESRPNLSVVHLFIAAPVSACFVTGQELRPRNNPPVQTYRFRRREDGGTMTPAILIRPTGPGAVDIPLSDGERSRAAQLRAETWEAALRDVERYAAAKKRDARPGERWYDRLEPREHLQRLKPFPALPPVYRMIPERSDVALDSLETAYYGYERESRRWRVNDRFLLALDRAFDGNVAEIRAVVRLFMFHESLHVAHGITKAKVEEVGKFANALEQVDYTADLYGVLHELDFAVGNEPALANDARAMREKVGWLIDLVIRSFWAFEDLPPLERMEIRRLRRYLNWYWQQIRVLRSGSQLQLAAVLTRKPVVEIAGLEPHVVSRRYYGHLRKFDPLVGLELALVLDNEELWRIPTSVTVPLEELMGAFSRQNHNDIRQAFRAIFDHVEGSKYALPTEEVIP